MYKNNNKNYSYIDMLAIKLIILNKFTMSMYIVYISQNTDPTAHGKHCLLKRACLKIANCLSPPLFLLKTKNLNNFYKLWFKYRSTLKKQ